MAGGDDDHTGDDDILPSWNIVVICTVGGVLMLEFLTHQMNAAAKGKKHAMELLEGLYRELAILGVVAFVLWSINVSEAVTIEYNDKHLFEQIHMTLFLAALFHSFPIGMVVLYSRQTIRRWDMFEDDEMRRYKDLKQQYRRTAAQLGIRHSQLKRGVGIFKWACLWTSHPILCRRLSELSEHVSYHALRSQFIKVNQLPKNFRFAAYLKKCEQEVVIGLAEIKHGVWVGLILFVAVELYVKGIMGKANSNADGRGLFLLAAALVISAALAVHFKLKHIYSTLVHTYRPSTERRDDLAQYLGPETSAQIPVRQIQQDMFWFGKPHLLLTALQTMQFVLAVMVSALIWFGAGESEGLLIVAEMLLAVGAFAIYIVVLPKFIPRFTQVTHIGGMVNRNILSETLLKQKKAFQRRTLPPTLRQVSVMARLKSNEALEYGLLFMGARKIMSAQGFREGVKVMVGVHFAIVAYNTNPVEQDSGDGLAWVAELVLSGIALLVEISTHFVVWRGMAFFHCNPFVEVPNRVANAPHKPAAAVYPSSSRRQLLDDDADASGGHDQEFGRSSAAASTRKETHMVCSIRACFGWSGGEYPTAGGGGCCPCLDGTPPESVVGAWRSLDLALILVVLGCAIATGLVEGVTRVVVHAIQGVVVLRLWPLSRCPFPPAVGFDTIRNVNGATVNHAPLDKNALEAVMRETLTLLRRQNPQEGTFEDRALAVETTNNGMIDENRLRDNGNPSTHKLNGSTNGKQETLTEEKDEDKDSEQDNDDGLAEDGIANVGVAMALRQACAAHPDLVQSHGPLSIPIMRAMLGLDPHKAKGQDDAKAFAIASRAVTLARSLSHLEENPSFIPYDEDRRAVFRRRRSSSGELPLAPEPSSPSSSDLSDGDTNDGAAERGVLGISQHGGGKRGRISSFLSGGGGRYRKNHSQHRHHHHQHQEPDQQQQHEQQQQQQGVYQQQQQQLLHQQQKQVQMMQQEHLKQLQYQRYQLGHHHNVSINQDPGTAYHHDPEQAHVGMLRSEHRGEFMTSRAMTGAAHPQIGTVPMGELGDAVIHTPFNPFNSAVAAGGGIVSSTRRSASTRGVNSTLNSHSRHQRRILHRNTSWDQIGGTVAAAFEDLERAVLPSLGSSAGSQYGGSNGGGRGGRGGVGGTGTGKGVSLAGGGRVPYSSGRSVPYSSGHHHAWRGTPAKALKGSASASANEQHPPAAASDDNKRNTAPPPRSNELTERKEIDGGGGRGRMGGSSGGGGGGVDDVDGGAGGAIGVGGIDGGAGVGDDGGGHDAFFGGGSFVSSVAHNGGGDGSLRHCGGGCVARYVADDGGDGRGGGGSYGSSNIGGDVEELREVRTSDATESGSGASATAENSTTPSTYLASMDAFQPKGNNAE